MLHPPGFRGSTNIKKLGSGDDCYPRFQLQSIADSLNLNPRFFATKMKLIKGKRLLLEGGFAIDYRDARVVYTT